MNEALEKYLQKDLLNNVPCGTTLGHGESCDHPEHSCDGCAKRTRAAGRLRSLVNLLLAAHPHKPNDRCTAREKPTEHPAGRPPGPANPPIFCCLPAGHEGPHRHSYGMGPSHPFRKAAEVEMREPGSGSCTTCRTGWPCDTIKSMEAILQEH